MENKTQSKKQEVKKELDNFISELSGFLLSRQVILQDISIQDSEEVVEVSPFKNEKKISWHFQKTNSTWSYKDEAGKWQKIYPDKPFRLPVLGIERQTSPFIAHGRRKNILAKLKYFFSYPDLLSRVLKHLAYKLATFWSQLGDRKPSTPAFPALAETGGLTFAVKKMSEKRLELGCLDWGGLYDYDLNCEGDTWPDQVPQDYYSTEFASFVFYWQWRKTKEEKWLSACKDSLQFFLNTYQPITIIAVDCYEFKILAISSLLDEIINDGQEENFPVEKIKSILSDVSLEYDPVNVQAMRLANYALLERLGLDYKKFKFNHALRVVKNNQTEQGLIADNRGGSLLYNADLTYHQFALACLLLANKQKNNQSIKEIIDRALSFSRYITTPEGHVSYYGRGANNIYHLASYLYAESQQKEPDLPAIEKILQRLKNFFTPESGLPAALNDQKKIRMAWNHCEIPYNGQTAFFLCLASDALSTETVLSNKQEKFSKKEKIAKPDYLVAKNKNLQLVVGRGSDANSWSVGAHVIGMGGICALAVGDTDILLTNEYSAVDKLWTGDLPYGKKMEKPAGNFFGKLKSIDKNTIKFYNKYILANYNLSEKALVVEYTLKKRTGYYKNFGSLSLRNAVLDNFSVTDNRADIYLTNGRKISLILKGSKYLTIETVGIGSNPFGKGTKFQFINLNKNKKLKKISWELKID